MSGGFDRFKLQSCNFASVPRFTTGLSVALVSSRLWSVFNNVAGGGQNWLCGLPQNRLFLRFFEISKIGPNGSELNSEHKTLAAFSKKLNFFRDI